LNAKAGEEPGKQGSKRKRRSAVLWGKASRCHWHRLADTGRFVSIQIHSHYAAHPAACDYLNPDFVTVKFFFAFGATFFRRK